MERQLNLPKITTAQVYALNSSAKQYSDRIELGRGDPDFDTPNYIIEGIKEFGNGDELYDSPVEGILPLRQAIAKRVKTVNHIDVDPETEVVVTNGGQEALFLMINTLLKEGDEILVPDPNYNSYRDSIKFARGVRVSIPTKFEDNFKVDLDLVREMVTDKTKVLLLVSPNNPAGSIMKKETIEAMIQIAVENDLLIIADDIYDRFVYDGLKHISVASYEKARKITVTLNACSKQFAMCGWRVGWIAGPKDLMAAIKNYKAIMTGPVPIIGQIGALCALNGDSDAVSNMYDTFVARRKTVMEGLDKIGIPYGVPEGGQFIFASIEKFGKESYTFAKEILENCHVLIYPGGAFGAQSDKYIRITFLQPEDKLREALDRMHRYLNR